MMTTANIENANLVFDVNWMDRLLKATNDLKDYALIPNMLHDSEYISNELRAAISNISDEKEKAILRMFVDNGQRYDLQDKLQNTPYNPEVNLDSWLQESIGYKNYCFTFNGIIKWNNHLHTQLTKEVVRPIIDSVGVPLAGLDTYAFFANSGYTPFGIHEDPDHSLIFHLGPNEKHVWIWKNEDYLKLTGSNDRRFDPENLKEYADHYALKPGDCLFIPKGDFHVFQNVGYSAFLGFILYPSTAKTVGNEGINMLTRFNGNNDEYFVDESQLKSKIDQQIEQITKSHEHDVDGGLKKGSYFYHLLLKSNGYAIHKPLLNKINPETLSNKTIINTSVFPILYEIDNGEITIFVRGRMMQLKNLPGIVETINTINEYREGSYWGLIDNLKELTSLEVSKFLVDSIIQYRGLKVEENNDNE
ncbi:hypothetical protein [Pontibacillus salipaludis]|uniref:hypothetical protein n=1 Tax=Pontibacillus salipaludis TaxID=1697394 RepID=UPI0031EEF254